MQTEPNPQHIWLQQLVGEWTSEFKASMGPDKPRETWKGSESVRAIGPFWIITEAQSEREEGTSVMTLGFDPQKERFVGTFVTSMMTYLWPYEGTLDESGQVLTLESEGPNMKDDGQTARYRDVIEIIGEDHRTFTSFFLGEEDEWCEFMTAHYRRVEKA